MCAKKVTNIQIVTHPYLGRLSSKNGGIFSQRYCRFGIVQEVYLMERLSVFANDEEMLWTNLSFTEQNVRPKKQFKKIDFWTVFFCLVKKKVPICK